MSTDDSVWAERRNADPAEPWAPTGTLYVTSGRPLQIESSGLQFDKTEADPVEWDPTVIRSTVSESWTITGPIKINRLELRAWRRMFGLPNPPLIHNGKKPRR